MKKNHIHKFVNVYPSGQLEFKKVHKNEIQIIDIALRSHRYYQQRTSPYKAW